MQALPYFPLDPSYWTLSLQGKAISDLSYASSFDISTKGGEGHPYTFSYLLCLEEIRPLRLLELPLKPKIA